ncbi:TPA: transposase [Serratia liquefaciens]|nr:transposase [Serratia liquefaciens]
MANHLFQQDIPGLYCSISRHITSTLSSLIVAVDWSACWRQEFQMLRASLLFEGRAIPRLNRIEPLKLQGNHYVHMAFLDELEHIIGPNRSVTIVTDAGYQTPWFTHVKAIGWDFVGRIRGNVQSLVDI